MSGNGGAPQVVAKTPVRRAQLGPKTLYIIMQLLDEDGKPMKIAKERLRIVQVETNAEAMLSAVDKGEKDFLFWHRTTLVPRKRASSTMPQVAAAVAGVAPTASRSA